MKKFVNYLLIYNLIICFVFILSGIFTAKSAADLTNSLIYLPLVFYFGLASLRHIRAALFQPTKSKILATIPLAKTPSQKTSRAASLESGDLKLIPDEPEEVKNVPDLDRRIFLRLIGSAGISIFLLSIFTKKTHAAFFGSVPGPGTVALKDIAGNKIDPAQEHPTDGYEVTEIDEDSDVTYSYFGFVHKNGAWYIAREQKATGSYRYAKGSSSFSTSWTNRKTESVTYGYYNTIFS
jgi:hypothetical protein